MRLAGCRLLWAPDDANGRFCIRAGIRLCVIPPVDKPQPKREWVCRQRKVCGSSSTHTPDWFVCSNQNQRILEGRNLAGVPSLLGWVTTVTFPLFTNGQNEGFALSCSIDFIASARPANTAQDRGTLPVRPQLSASAPASFPLHTITL